MRIIVEFSYYRSISIRFRTSLRSYTRNIGKNRDPKRRFFRYETMINPDDFMLGLDVPLISFDWTTDRLALKRSKNKQSPEFVRDQLLSILASRLSMGCTTEDLMKLAHTWGSIKP